MVTSFNDKFGRIEMYLDKGVINTYLVKAHGIIRLSLLKKYLNYLKQMDHKGSYRFNHIVDTTKVKFANPLNPFFLRSISKLDRFNLYIVIVPSNFLRTMVRLTKWINRPDYVFKSQGQFDISELNLRALSGDR